MSHLSNCLPRAACAARSLDAAACRGFTSGRSWKRIAPKKVLGAAIAAGRRRYHFASSTFDSAFGSLPIADAPKLRQATLDYLSKFDKTSWFAHPICTIVKGIKFVDGDIVDTVDAFGAVNGKQILSDSKAHEALLCILKELETTNAAIRKQVDFRNNVRRLESELLSPELAAVLIGNQMVDFKKQDGITEIEESVQANAVERRLNDQLIMEEDLGHVRILRTPAIILCVNNFTNFLDLFRKVLRNIELGVPVVIMSRFNTAQHSFRWVELLLRLMDKHEVPSWLVTYASLDLPRQRALMAAHGRSPVYFTGSREAAARIRPVAPRLVASTAGPNTMLATALTPAVAQAIRWSACIEHSGQCTALRHVILPAAAASDAQVASIFASTPTIKTPAERLEQGEFAALYGDNKLSVDKGYKTLPGLPVAYRMSGKLPEAGIQEHWREVYLDITTSPEETIGSERFISDVSAWLVREQPISLSVNGPVELALRLWEKTGTVVFTHGTTQTPALSCQARPQDGECFGELPPRADMGLYTRFPVVIPSPTAAYNATYEPSHLALQALAPAPPGAEFCRPLLERIEKAESRGYAVVLLRYLADSAVGPRRSRGARTCLYGLQRPPLDGRKTVLRCPDGSSFDQLAPLLLPFFATNARSQVEISVSNSAGPSVRAALESLDLGGIPVHYETEEALKARSPSPYNVARAEPAGDEYPLAGQWVTCLMSPGHCKTVVSGSEAEGFVAAFEASDKWLRLRSS